MNYDDDYNGLSFSYQSGGTFDSEAADWDSGEPIMHQIGDNCVQAIYNILGRWKVIAKDMQLKAQLLISTLKSRLIKYLTGLRD